MKDVVDSISVVPAWRQVTDAIRRAIHTGRLKPGDRVIESRLSEWLGISRNPIREAVRQLQQQGILDYTQYSGTVVTHMSDSDIMMSVRVRAFLETQAGQIIVTKPNLECLDDLEAIIEKMSLSEHGGDVEEVERLDEEFHRQLILISGSEMLRKTWDAISPYTWIKMAMVQFRCAVRIKGGSERHQYLVDTLRSRDSAVFEEAVCDHVMEPLLLRVRPSGHRVRGL